MSKENIDRLFQEKFKDFEMVPDAKIWAKIEDSVNTKTPEYKKPMWLWFGAAAILLLGFILFYNKGKINKVELIADKITNDRVLEDSSKLKLTRLKNKNNVIVLNNPSLKSKRIIHKKKMNELIKGKKNFGKKLKEQQLLEINIISSSNGMMRKKVDVNYREKEKKKLDSGVVDKKTMLTSLMSEIIKKNKKDVKNELAAQVNQKEVSVKKKKWIIAPVFSQIFSNTFSNTPTNGSGISEGINSNSIGLKIAFASSKKWTFQSGIHQVTLGQRFLNNNIISSRSIELDSSVGADENTNNQPKSEIITNSDTSNNSVDETYSYIEIPLELKYNFMQSKNVGLHLLTGMSAFVLTSNNLNNQAGERLNNLNYSINLGTDLEYYLSKKWFLNVSPVLKLPLNTFNNIDATPYYWGVSSGVNFKF